MESWNKDCNIDRTDLLSAMYSFPILHSKYLTILQSYKVNVRKLTLKFQKLRLLKQRYYNGELTKEELDGLGWDQYLFKRPLKAELETLIDADSEIQILQEKILYIQSLVESTEMIMKDISNRYYLFKNLVEYEKFLAGK